MMPRSLFIPILHIDTNLINARQKLNAINQLEKWDNDGVISIIMSATALGEAQAGGNAVRTRKANQNIFTATLPVKLTDPLFVKVQNALFPNVALDENKLNDVRIVCEAAKYSAILVTNDGNSNSQPGGILGNRHNLVGIVNILSPDEAVDFVRQKIQERDNFNLEFVKKFGGVLPSWAGND